LHRGFQGALHQPFGFGIERAAASFAAAMTSSSLAPSRP